MLVISPLERAILDGISHNQEIGKKSGLLEKKVYLSVTKKAVFLKFHMLPLIGFSV
jgi:hypothetical protein